MNIATIKITPIIRIPALILRVLAKLAFKLMIDNLSELVIL